MYLNHEDLKRSRCLGIPLSMEISLKQFTTNAMVHLCTLFRFIHWSKAHLSIQYRDGRLSHCCSKERCKELADCFIHIILRGVGNNRVTELILERVTSLGNKGTPEHCVVEGADDTCS